MIHLRTEPTAPLSLHRTATAERFVEDVRRIAGEPSHVEDRLARLRDAMDRFVADTHVPAPETWRNTTGRYTRVLLNDPEDDFQILVVFWPPGARSAIHDHDDTDGAVMPLFGRLSETKYAVDAHADGTVALERSRAGVLEPHTFSPITDVRGEQLHDMVNETYEWGATIHVYLRRIDEFQVYAHQPGGRYRPVQRRLWFDYHTGWKAWDQAPPEPSEPARPLRGVGHCLCGATRFAFLAEPALQLVCHCTDCQRWTGSTHAPLAFFPTHSLRRLSGRTTRHDHTNDSGHVVTREFCAFCGSSLFHTSSSATHLTAVPVGVLDDSTGFRPTTEIYVGSAPHWVRIAPRPCDDARSTGNAVAAAS